MSNFQNPTNYALTQFGCEEIEKGKWVSQLQNHLSGITQSRRNMFLLKWYHCGGSLDFTKEYPLDLSKSCSVFSEWDSLTVSPVKIRKVENSSNLLGDDPCPFLYSLHQVGNHHLYFNTVCYKQGLDLRHHQHLQHHKRLKIKSNSPHKWS